MIGFDVPPDLLNHSGPKEKRQVLETMLEVVAYLAL